MTTTTDQNETEQASCAPATGSAACDKPREQLTLDDLRRWMFDHYQQHMEDGAINVNALEAALAVYFRGKPNPMLHEIVIEFCLDLQEAASRQSTKLTD